jgi:hypothetical protein
LMGMVNFDGLFCFHRWSAQYWTKNWIIDDHWW